MCQRNDSRMHRTGTQATDLRQPKNPKLTHNSAAVSSIVWQQYRQHRQLRQYLATTLLHAACRRRRQYLATTQLAGGDALCGSSRTSARKSRRHSTVAPPNRGDTAPLGAGLQRDRTRSYCSDTILFKLDF
jgi:hypothetical protein